MYVYNYNDNFHNMIDSSLTNSQTSLLSSSVLTAAMTATGTCACVNTLLLIHRLALVVCMVDQLDVL